MLLIINESFVLFGVFNYFIGFVVLFIFLNLSLNTSPNGEYSNVGLSTTPGLYPKSSPVKYSYLCSSLDDNAEILAASQSKSY